MKRRSTNTVIYGNFAILDPSGHMLCRCSQDRIEWYLSRNLATSVDEKTIRLNFEPKGRGHINDPYYTSHKKNICAVCGTDKHLSKHHCVPLRYRKFFPEAYKRHNSHDVVPLCLDCHDKYEVASQELNRVICEENGIPTKREPIDDVVSMARKSAHSLIIFKGKIPKERADILMGKIQKYLGRFPTWEDVENVSNEPFRLRLDNMLVQAEKVAKSITDIEAFIRRWRQHFISTMDPKFLPEHWDANRTAIVVDNSYEALNDRAKQGL